MIAAFSAVVIGVVPKQVASQAAVPSLAYNTFVLKSLSAMFVTIGKSFKLKFFACIKKASSEI